MSDHYGKSFDYYVKTGRNCSDFFNALRKAYFPAHVNYLDAHITLFHALPTAEPLIQQILEELSNRTVMMLDINSIKNTGNGVAYMISSAELQDMHIKMQHFFAPWLIPQDKQKLKAHITIQNKVTAFKALQLAENLQETFQPFQIEAKGISTWLYLKGPWEHIHDFNFRPSITKND